MSVVVLKDADPLHGNNRKPPSIFHHGRFLVLINIDFTITYIDISAHGVLIQTHIINISAVVRRIKLKTIVHIEITNERNQNLPDILNRSRPITALLNTVSAIKYFKNTSYMIGWFLSG